MDSTVAAASSLATQQIALLRKDLRLQMAPLRKNRDSMLDDLANELTVMSPGLAAQEVRLLDDESAALVLARLTVAQREAVLKSLDRKRARMLDRKARTWAAK